MARVSAADRPGRPRREPAGSSCGPQPASPAAWAPARLRQAPAFAQTRELTFLSVASFVPDTDKELKRQFEEWGSQEQGQGAARHHRAPPAADQEGRRGAVTSGHDLTALGPGLGDADLYFDYLVDLNDLATDVAPKNGGWLNPNDYLIRGKWKLLPWWQPPFPMAIAPTCWSRSARRHPTPGRTGCASARRARPSAIRSAPPWATAATPTSRCCRSSGRTAAPTSPRTARRSPSTRKRRARPWSSSSGSTPRPWIPRCWRGTTPATTAA